MSNNYIKTYESFKIKESIRKFLESFKSELVKKNELRKIFLKYFRNIPITTDERETVREESLDIIKLLGMGTIFVLPGSMLIIPFIVKMCKKYNINIVPNILKLESVTTDEMVDLIGDGKKIFVKYIQDYPEHEEDNSYTAVDVDNDGNITLDIDNNLYYTKIEWVEGIDEMMHIDVTSDNTSPMADESTYNRTQEWKYDAEYVELLKTQGGIKNIISKMKSKYGIDYSEHRTKNDLYWALKTDNMI